MFHASVQRTLQEGSAPESPLLTVRTLAQKSSAIPNDGVNQVDHLLKRFNDRLTLKNLRLGERYVNGELHVLIYFRVRGSSMEFVASLQRDIPVGPRWGDEFDARQGRMSNPEYISQIGPVTFRDAASLVRCSDSQQQTVLIDNVKLMQTPEKVISIPTFVWFDCVDKFYRILPQALYFSDRLRFVLRGTLENRETKNPVWCDTRTMNREQLMHEMLQGGSSILENVSSNDGDSVGNIPDLGHVIDQLSRIRIALGSDFIWAFFEPTCFAESLNLEPQIVEVLFGPFNFYPN